MTSSRARPRVAIVGIRWPPETFLQLKIRGLLAHRFDVAVVTRSRPAPVAGLEAVDIIRVPGSANLWWRAAEIAANSLAASMRSPAGALRLGRYAAGARRPMDILRSIAPLIGRAASIYHFEWVLSAVEYAALLELSPAPVTVSCRGTQVSMAGVDTTRAGMYARLPAIFNRAAAVHCVSNDMREQALRQGLAPEKAAVIRPAVDSSFFEPSSGPRVPGPFRMTTVASLAWIKGHEYALVAMARLRAAGHEFHYDIVGGGTRAERQRVLYTIHDLGLAGAVSIHNELSPTQVRDLLRQSDAVVLASLSEGISNAVLEGMACGLPAVTTDCGGMREAVEDGVHGFVVPVRDSEAMAAALGNLINNPERHAAMGAAARRRIEAEFDARHQARQWAEFYRRVLER